MDRLCVCVYFFASVMSRVKCGVVSVQSTVEVGSNRNFCLSDTEETCSIHFSHWYLMDRLKKGLPQHII